MKRIKKVKPAQLYFLAKDEILNYILESQLQPGDLLPPEGQLSKQLGISRGTLREAMRIIEEEGVVRRKQGVGTFIGNADNLIRSTLDINEGVSEMIIGKGMKPGSREIKVEEIRASKKHAELLNLMPGEPLISLTRVRTADGLPLAYTIDFLPQRIIQGAFPRDFGSRSLYCYIEEDLGIEVTNSLLQIQPVKAPKSIAHALEIRPATILLLLKQTDTDTCNVPVVYSEEYFIAERFEFVVYRRVRKRANERKGGEMR